MADENAENQGASQVVDPPATTEEQPPVPQAEKTVPYDRFQEQNRLLNEVIDQNRAMRQIIDEKLKPQAPLPDPADELLDPQVRAIKQENAQLKNAFGGLADQMDDMKVRSNPTYKDYSKYADKVDQVRRQSLANGQYISREQVYLYLKGQEVINAPVRPAKAEPEVEPEQQPIPRTQPAATNAAKPKKPLTLEEERELLKNEVF